MFSILERMFETLGQMLRENMNQHVDPICHGCGGLHEYEDCPVAFRWVMPSVAKGIHWAEIDDWDLNRCMNKELVDATELTDMKTPLEDAEGTSEDDEVDIEEGEVEEEEFKEELTSDLELSDVELETTTDDSVPPPFQLDVKPNWYSTPWYYCLETIYDDFWIDDDEGEDVDEPLDKMEDK
ncbi:hypothetical protein HanXRQr2_Chr04g0164161 [Helianthus annuus]|uniref:Uncharacterized protein n=1 Tax=Helianthus annuus TaxID=4232 RepID=A0A9K3J771_HELAN|nr:hypothetical protein HanXRQr2_Chr04g0164161 [Helianthus annuus]KAJ0580909.1 hypothetical protein HanHA300_Chr04g0134831 [Helianthus annuus]KAJ0596850.1 hypothetical protein HanHA89_Chr04g0147721 [Helianthus annuus]KAJ0757529.1 hypothetical protein HanLR1_Chr04g0139811 [Helianthus annuus]KAJ0761216.1 hypothetical protein HanOQP8_Chr04g0147221 [Helianthus annuus]